MHTCNNTKNKCQATSAVNLTWRIMRHSCVLYVINVWCVYVEALYMYVNQRLMYTSLLITLMHIKLWWALAEDLLPSFCNIYRCISLRATIIIALSYHWGMPLNRRIGVSLETLSRVNSTIIRKINGLFIFQRSYLPDQLLKTFDWYVYSGCIFGIGVTDVYWWV